MVSGVPTPTLPDGVYEHGGLLWRPKPGATSKFEENLAARALFLDLHRDEFWNPWRIEERAGELALALETMEQWERAEPGFKQMTLRQWNTKMAREDRRRERERAQGEVKKSGG